MNDSERFVRELQPDDLVIAVHASALETLERLKVKARTVEKAWESQHRDALGQIEGFSARHVLSNRPTVQACWKYLLVHETRIEFMLLDLLNSPGPKETRFVTRDPGECREILSRLDRLQSPDNLFRVSVF